jgi:hypothetical protein
MRRFRWLNQTHQPQARLNRKDSDMGFFKRNDQTPTPAANPAAAPVAAPSLQDQFKQAAIDMRAGKFKRSLDLFEALSKNQDALVAAKISRTMVAFCLAVNHVQLADDKALASSKVLETIGDNSKIDSKMRAEAFQILSTVHMNYSLRMKDAKESEKQALAPAAFEKAKAYAAKALEADPESALAKLAAADVAVQENRIKDAYELTKSVTHQHVGLAKVAYARIMDDVGAYILELDDEPKKSADPSADSSAGFDAITDEDLKKEGGGKGPGKDKPDEDLGGPGGAGSRVPNQPRTPGLGSGAKPPKTDEGTPDPRRPIVRQRTGEGNPIALVEPS